MYWSLPELCKTHYNDISSILDRGTKEIKGREKERCIAMNCHGNSNLLIFSNGNGCDNLFI